MTMLAWHTDSPVKYETGIDRGVLYPIEGPGVVWNGLISVEEQAAEDSIRSYYIDGIKYLDVAPRKDYKASIRAFSVPREFLSCLGERVVRPGCSVANQPRARFNLSYRTMTGVDSYKIHLVYNAFASPANVNHRSIDGSASTDNFSWDISTVPIKMGPSYSAHLVIDPRLAYATVIEDLERMLYGSPDNDPYLPSPQEVLDLFEDSSILKITDHGDGTWTAEGPDEAIRMLDPTTFEITWPSAVYIDAVTYRISSL